MNPTIRTTVRTFLIIGMIIAGLTLAVAQGPGEQGSYPASANTKMNSQDPGKSKPAADQQKKNRSDQRITRRIRRAIMKDRSLSTDACNVTIITQNGVVTLKGPVRSEEEKNTIEAKASEIAGEGKVVNELQITPN